MEVSSYSSMGLTTFDQPSMSLIENNEMDVDMEIDLGPINDDEMIQTEAIQLDLPIPHIPTINSTTEISGPSSEQTNPHKIHIRGVDDLTTNDIRAFSKEYFSQEPPSRIEWIDDTSANIVFETPTAALEALSNLTLGSIGDISSIPVLQLRPTKPSSTRPNSSLQIRMALVSDQKRPHAHEASRFYMMHPEYDPREKRRRQRSNNNGHEDYHRRRYDHEEHRRRRKADDEGSFDASMYDDDVGIVAVRDNGVSNRRNSHSTLSLEGDACSSGRDHRSLSKRQVDSYRPRRYSHNNSRDRSASPGKGSDNDTPSSNRQRYSRRTPPPKYASRDPYPIPIENSSKELFPTKLTPATKKELFPNKKAATSLKKEIFPLRAGTSIHSHRRSDAFDAADETADLFATGMSVPFVDGAVDPNSGSRSLADRITSPSSSASHTSKPALANFGRLRNSDPDPDPEVLEDLESGGFNIRGAAKQPERGFSIRGIAGEGSVKELFPGRGNRGKELFAEKLVGRGTRRNRAEDMFY